MTMMLVIERFITFICRRKANCATLLKSMQFYFYDSLWQSQLTTSRRKRKSLSPTVSDEHTVGDSGFIFLTFIVNSFQLSFNALTNSSSTTSGGQGSENFNLDKKRLIGSFTSLLPVIYLHNWVSFFVSYCLALIIITISLVLKSQWDY